MRVLIIGDANSIHLMGFVTNLQRKKKIDELIIYNIGSSCTEINKNSYTQSAIRIVESVRLNEKSLISKIPRIRFYYLIHLEHKLLESLGKMDFIHIHYVSSRISAHAKLFSIMSSKIISTFWGSDLYRSSRREIKLQTKLVKYSERITLVTNQVKEDFQKNFGSKFNEKIRIVPFGLIPLTYINQLDSIETKNESREKIGIPNDAFVIACGYNARPMQQHLKIIEAFNNYEAPLPENLLFIFPMGYGGDATDAYKLQVKEALMNSKIKGYILEEYLEKEAIARFRRSCDVMINIQTSDASSGSMLEHLCAGSVVINGEWLPYKPHEDMGACFVKVKSTKELPETICDILNNLEFYKNKCNINKEIINKFALWENTIEKWINIYNEL